MKKFLIVLLTILMFISSTFPVFAQNDFEFSSEIDKSEIARVHQQMLKLVKEGKEEQIKDLYLVKKYQELFKRDKNALKEYLENVDVLNQEKVLKKLEQSSIEITIGSNNGTKSKREIIEMDDGSFLVIDIEDSPQKYDFDNKIGLDVINDFGSRETTYTYYRYHVLFPDTKLVLKTFYDLSSSGITITGASTAGSYSVFPVVLNRSYTITQPEASTEGSYATSQGDYLLNYLGTNGIALFSEEITLRTRYKLNSINSSSVDYDIINSVHY